MNQDFENTKALFLKAGGDGKSLYDHLTEVFMQIAKEKPNDPLASFESLSVKVKQAAVQLQRFRELPNQDSDASKKQLLASLKRTTELLQGPKGEDDAKQSNDDLPIADIMAHTELLESAGIVLGKEQMYKLLLSIQELTHKEELSDVRFFGKFFGTARDYYLVEAKKAQWPDDPAEDEKEVKGQAKKAPKEKWGEGANDLIYYACNHPGGAWTALPLVTPQQIEVARSTRRFLTGDLKAPVLGFPRFAWGEASYLRAQIARIAASTLVSPKGFFTAEGDGEDAVAAPAEDFKALAVTDLLSGDNWSHHRRYLFKQGRTKFWKEETEDDAQAQNKDADEEPVPLLRALSDDEPAGTSWTFRRSSEGAGTAHDAVSAHSLIWPGAVSIFKGKTLASVYVGYGQRYLSQPYSPPAPPAVQQEFVPKASDEDKEPMVEQVDPPKPADADTNAEQEEKEKKSNEDEGDDAGEEETED